MLRISHCVGNRLTDGGKVVSLMLWQRYTPLKHYFSVRSEVFMAVTMKNGVFCDVTPRGSCKNRSFGGTQRLLHQGDKNR
jgi:hypothetical protein